MARKKSIRRSAQDFVAHVDEIQGFVDAARRQDMSEQHVLWVYEYAIIRLYCGFESLILDALVGTINNNTRTISTRTGIDFPKHLTDEVCEYLILQNGYFDFKGRGGLIKTLKKFVPPRITWSRL